MENSKRITGTIKMGDMKERQRLREYKMDKRNVDFIFSAGFEKAEQVKAKYLKFLAESV